MASDQDDNVTTPGLRAWCNTVCEELGIGPDINDESGKLLELAQEIASGVNRPAATMSLFLLGYATGRGASLDDSIALLAAVTPAALPDF